MERSGRFISLSGWSGIAVGICALTGAYIAHTRISHFLEKDTDSYAGLKRDLILLAGGVFLFSFFLAALFTYFKSRKDHVAIWGTSAKRLLWNTLLPMLAGGIVIWRLLELDIPGIIAPLCLIFYGLALVNGSKYTMGEVRYLGYAEMALGFVNLWLDHKGLICWAIGFGIFHILYGLVMWWKYERTAPGQP